MSTSDEFQAVDYSKVYKFSLKDHVYNAKVINVYDGDTITVVFKFKDEFYKWNCRLNGIDTPEMKSKDLNEKNAAIRARNFLREKILGKIVKLYCSDFDKYGRLLVIVEYEDENINNTMIDNGYGKYYFGGKKEDWDL
jgi:micrococcal nuclease